LLTSHHTLYIAASRELHLLRAESLFDINGTEAIFGASRELHLLRAESLFCIVHYRVLMASFKGAAPVKGRITTWVRECEDDFWSFKGAAPVKGRITTPSLPFPLPSRVASRELHLLRAESQKPDQEKVAYLQLLQGSCTC